MKYVRIRKLRSLENVRSLLADVTRKVMDGADPLKFELDRAIVVARLASEMRQVIALLTHSEVEVRLRAVEAMLAEPSVQ